MASEAPRTPLRGLRLFGGTRRRLTDPRHPVELKEVPQTDNRGLRYLTSKETRTRRSGPRLLT